MKTTTETRVYRRVLSMCIANGLSIRMAYSDLTLSHFGLFDARCRQAGVMRYGS